MLGKYGETIHNRPLYQQNINGMNIVAGLYHNPPTSVMLQFQKPGGIVQNQNIQLVQFQKPLEQNQSSTTAPNESNLQPQQVEFKCRNCQKQFTSENEINQHMASCNQRQNEPPPQQQAPIAIRPPQIIYATTNPQYIKTEYHGHPPPLHNFSNKPFECHLCDKSFMTIINLNLHLEIHENDPKKLAIQQPRVVQSYPILVPAPGTVYNQEKTEFRCKICHKEFIAENYLESHMKLHEYEFRNRALYQQNIYQSPQIIAITTTPSAQKPEDPHRPQQTELKLHKCPFCHKMFENIVEHLKIHENEYKSQQTDNLNSPPPPQVQILTQPPFYPNPNAQHIQSGEESESSHEGTSQDSPSERTHECFICHKKFSSAGNLSLHIKIHSGDKPFKCSICDKGFIQSNNLATHMKTHTGEKPYECSVCQKHFSQSNNLKTHMRTHTGEKPYICTLCDKRFNQKNNLTTHMRTHTLICSLCGVQFVHPGDLTNHMKFHGHNEEKPFICSKCNRAYLSFDQLTEHMRSHSVLRPYQCHICEKQFTQSNNLKTHMKTHIFQDPYKCHMCSRSFQTVEDFTQHMLVHTADKPYECTYCGKRFIQSNNLKTHVRTHTGEKPFICIVCNKHFNQKNNLNTHLRIHTGEKPFECTICDKRFNQSNNLNKHIKTHMGIVEKEES